MSTTTTGTAERAAGIGSKLAPSPVWRLIFRSAGARLLVLPISAILGIINTRLIISHFGKAAYGQYGLLVGIGSLIPFADLGITAAIINAIGKSDDPRRELEVRRTLITALRVLTCSSLGIVGIATVISVCGWWPTLLGQGLLKGSGPVAAGLCLGVFGLTVMVGWGQQVLTALGKNHVTMLMLGLQTPAVLLSVILVVVFKGHLGAYVAVSAYLATFLLSLGVAIVASRNLAPMVRLAYRDAVHVRTVRGARIFGIAWPMLVQMVALPLAMQTDRLVLSHVSNLTNLAEYNLASQLYTPVWAVISSAGVTLWPVFARARAKPGGVTPSPARTALIFGSAAALVCVILSLVSPWLTQKASGGQVHLGIGLLVAFTIFMSLQGIKYPLGMYMTDAPGLRYQAYMIVLLLPVNLGLSWYLAIHWGAAGPIVGSAVGVFFCQVLANFAYVARKQRVGTIVTE